MTTVETYANLDEAAQAMGSDAAFLGGGTLLMRAVNEGNAPARLVRVRDTGHRVFHSSGDTLTLGASMTMTDVLNQRELAFLHPVARVIGGPQIRNMATVAGNLFAGHPYGDFAAALLALDARVLPVGPGSAHSVEDLLQDRTRAGLVRAIEIHRPRDPRAFGFLKVSRVKPKGVSVLSIAAHLPREAGRIRGARIAFGAMGDTPLRSVGAERALEGQSLDTAHIEHATAAVLEGLAPQTDQIASEWYRREVAGVHLKRLLSGMERI